MGLVRKANSESVAAGDGGSIDMSAVIRQAVAAEIERQQREGRQRDAERDADQAGESD